MSTQSAAMYLNNHIEMFSWMNVIMVLVRSLRREDEEKSLALGRKRESHGGHGV